MEGLSDRIEAAHARTAVVGCGAAPVSALGVCCAAACWEVSQGQYSAVVRQGEEGAIRLCAIRLWEAGVSPGWVVDRGEWVQGVLDRGGGDLGGVLGVSWGTALWCM